MRLDIVLLAVCAGEGLCAQARAQETRAANSQQMEIATVSVEQLVAETLENSPDYARAKATAKAAWLRVPQVGALPDPTLSLGIQNDGFHSIQVGKMETSWLYIIASQTFPWFGTLGMRSSQVRFQARQAEADLARARLTLEAEVRRGYVDLLLVRDQLALLGRLETLWSKSQDLARSRYEAGVAPQSDILRAQLEQNRLRQRRFLLGAEEHQAVAALNRLRAHPPTEPIPTAASLANVSDPPMMVTERAVEDAEARSPELTGAQLAVEQSDVSIRLAHKQYFPDVTVTAGVMPRWGPFETMWTAGLSFSLPVWAGSKQSKAVAEGEAQEIGATAGVDAVRNFLRLRVEERQALLGAVVEANRLYRSGLLVQSEATVSSTMAQYGVGKVTFASVLEALAGYLNDENGYLESVASAQRIAIAAQEVSLDSVQGAVGPMVGAPMPGAGGMNSGANARQMSSPAAASPGAAASVPPPM